MAENYTEITPENEEELDVVELKDDEGKIFKFYHIGTIEHKERWFAFFQPAEKIDGVNPDEVVIFEIVGDEGDESLAPIEDQKLLDEVYEAFIAEMDDCDCDDDCDCGEHEHNHEHNYDHGNKGCGCGCKH